MSAAVEERATAPFRDIGRRLSNWGRWGEADELGTVNLITPECRVRAAGLIRDGEVFDLGFPLGAEGPMRGGSRFNPIHRMTALPGEELRPGGMVVADDMITMPLQCSTQWDGLAHVGYDDMLYNGAPLSTVTARAGATRNSVDKVASAIVGRGVLLDVAGLRGVERMEAGDEITAADLEAAARSQGVAVESGDVLLVRTGWYRLLEEGDFSTYMGRGAPGIGVDCCEWLHRQGAAAVAADTRAVEVDPSTDPEAVHPVHMILIRDMGMTLGEFFDLEALAAACRSDGRYEFFFCGTGLKVTGGIGTPLTPVAIR